MKKLTFTLLMFLGIAMTLVAQNNLIFFSENGEQFYVILNGIRQNEKPQTNVLVKGLNAAMFKAKIIFADQTLGIVDKNIPMPEEPTEMTFVVKQAKDGKYVIKWMGQVPIAQAAPPAPGRTEVVYNTAPMPPIENVTVTQTTTTTTTNDPNNVSINVNMPGINMTVTDPNVQTTSKTTYTTTTTTTSTPPPAPTREVYVMKGYNGAVGCPWPMSEADFNSAKASITSKPFEESKLTLAKQIFDSNCLLSAQVKQIMQSFSFEESKLEFAKYAYGRTYDIGNYYKVNDAFTFSSSIDDLNTYIQANKR